MQINNISFSYEKEKPLIQSITSRLEPGKITAIIGPNGSGKSTLLQLICQQLAPNAGEIILENKSIQSYKLKELAKKLAVVHQQNEAPEEITVEKLIQFGRYPYQSMFSKWQDKDVQAVEEALSSTNLLHKRTQPVTSLSGGERQRVWIAMAIAQQTPILLLDEPTTYLDIYHQYEILQLIRKLNAEKGYTIAMVLHDINQAIQFSDIIMIMKNGQLIKTGKPKDVITKQMMEDVYGIHVVVSEDEQVGYHVIPVSTS